ncbi:hypothetical protein [Arthrobacter sp. B10-11]|uniref:hypothetical protein n=1 Tax=Arthrobacter sp. B10-11 TaxID=3081160 RepID=UPI00295529D9|nr:hypothetical protein [Arthrobacter sp. B10-11]MDV8147441.1 hypothetical protein [Arthrobacter sp. B10-11]
MSVRRSFYISLQTINTTLFIGGTFLFITWSVELAARLADYEARGLHADNDVIRGPALIIMTGLMAALFSACAFLLLRIGHWWACWIDVAIWILAWFPTAINLNASIRGFGYELASMICAIGILLAAATFFLMPWENKLPTNSGNVS